MISSITFSNGLAAASAIHPPSEQNEQCFGQARIVGTEVHTYLSVCIKFQRAATNSSPLICPVIDALRTPCFEISEYLAPHYISIALDHCVCRSPPERLLGERCGVPPYTTRAPRLCASLPHFISAQRIASVCTLIPTISPGRIVWESSFSRDSSTNTGSLMDRRVAAASTNNYLGVIAAVQKNGRWVDQVNGHTRKYPRFGCLRGSERVKYVSARNDAPSIGPVRTNSPVRLFYSDDSTE
jgi:hypothetical protein